MRARHWMSRTAAARRRRALPVSNSASMARGAGSCSGGPPARDHHLEAFASPRLCDLALRPAARLQRVAAGGAHRHADLSCSRRRVGACVVARSARACTPRAAPYAVFPPRSGVPRGNPRSATAAMPGHGRQGQPFRRRPDRQRPRKDGCDSQGPTPPRDADGKGATRRAGRIRAAESAAAGIPLLRRQPAPPALTATGRSHPCEPAAPCPSSGAHTRIGSRPCRPPSRRGRPPRH